MTYRLFGIWDTADLPWLPNWCIARGRFCQMLNLFRSTDSAKPDFSLACWITSTPRTSSLLAVGLASESTSRVVDPTGKEVETGKTGELVARGANIMRGYWNKPEETKLAFRNGFFRTGDVGYQDANGYFYILDRLKDMIVTGGENVYSGEVEAVIYTHPAVREVAVFGIPDPKWGEIVKACRCPQAGENTHCGRVDRVLPTIPRQFQSSAQHRVFRNRAAEERLRQNTKEASA